MKCAFAIYAKGDMYRRFRENLMSKLEKYVPGVPVIDVDEEEALKYIPVRDDWMKAYVIRLAIPLMEQFRQYDRVIWMDCDIDLVADGFSDILECETSDDGFSMVVHAFDKEMNDKLCNRAKTKFGSYDKGVYFNAGVIVMDLKKVSVEKMKAAISDLIDKKYEWLDQDTLNFHFDIKPIDPKFNFIYGWNRHYPEGTKPCALHYVTPRRHRRLYDILQTEDNGGTPPVDAVFVIGKGSKHENEELRYALRSLDSNCKFVRNVYICGECPEWVDKSSVIHLPWPDRFRHAKDANIIDKLKHACERKEIAKRIIFCSDDQFQIVECSWDDFSPKYLRKYKEGDKWIDEREGGWFKYLKGTLSREIKRRKEKGLSLDSVYYYEPHIWAQIDRDRFLEYAKWSEYDKSKYTIIMSGYFNYIDAKTESKVGHHHFLSGNEKYLPDVVHIAYTDGESYDTAMKFLRLIFRDRSRFELDDFVAEPVQDADPESMAGIFGMRFGTNR